MENCSRQQFFDFADLDQNCLTPDLIVFLKEIFEKVKFKKSHLTKKS